MLYKTAIAILKILEEDLLDGDFEEIMKILKSTQEHVTNEEELVRLIMYEVQIPPWIESELPRLENDKILDNLN